MTPDSFIARWSAASASERSNSQSFLSELADLLGVDRPHNHFAQGYAFEYTVTEHHHDGSTSDRRIDLYKRGCFVLREVGTSRCDVPARASGRNGITATRQS